MMLDTFSHLIQALNDDPKGTATAHFFLRKYCRNQIQSSFTYLEISTSHHGRTQPRDSRGMGEWDASIRGWGSIQVKWWDCWVLDLLGYATGIRRLDSGLQLVARLLERPDRHSNRSTDHKQGSRSFRKYCNWTWVANIVDKWMLNSLFVANANTRQIKLRLQISDHWRQVPWTRLFRERKSICDQIMRITNQSQLNSMQHLTSRST